MTMLRSIAANDLVNCNADAQGGTPILAGVSAAIIALPPPSAQERAAIGAKGRACYGHFAFDAAVDRTFMIKEKAMAESNRSRKA